MAPVWTGKECYYSTNSPRSYTAAARCKSRPSSDRRVCSNGGRRSQGEMDGWTGHQSAPWTVARILRYIATREHSAQRCQNWPHIAKSATFWSCWRPKNECGDYRGRQRRRNEFESGGGHRSGAGKNFWVVPLHFLAVKVQLVVLVNAFVMVSTLWSLSCLLFFYSRCPRAPCSRRH